LQLYTLLLQNELGYPLAFVEMRDFIVCEYLLVLSVRIDLDAFCSCRTLAMQ
jgi:hypothetical protein